MNTTINFTEQAAEKVHSLITEEENPALNLRIYITGGGCSGFQYGFTFDETINADDRVVERTLTQVIKADASVSHSDETQTVVKLLIDPMSYQYLTGAEIDYQEDIQGAQFVIRNPSASSTCGCGSSFSI